MDYSHIERAIELHDEVVNKIAEFHKENPNIFDDGRRHIDKSISLMVLKLLHFMNKNLAAPVLSDVELEQVKNMFNKTDENNNDPKTYLEKFRDIPPTLLETVIPVAIARNLFCWHKLYKIADVLGTPYIVKGNDVTPWPIFADRYCNLILSA